MKTDTDAGNNGIDASAFAVSCRQLAKKDMYGKLGNPVVSMNMPRKVVE